MSRLTTSKTTLFGFCFYKHLTNQALKKVQYGCHGKNGNVSDQTERT